MRYKFKDSTILDEKRIIKGLVDKDGIDLKFEDWQTFGSSNTTNTTNTTNKCEFIECVFEEPKYSIGKDGEIILHTLTEVHIDDYIFEMEKRLKEEENKSFKKISIVTGTFFVSFLVVSIVIIAFVSSLRIVQV
jgi:hypothetical protein